MSEITQLREAAQKQIERIDNALLSFAKMEEEYLEWFIKEFPAIASETEAENRLQEIRLNDNRCMDCGEGELHSKGLCVGCLEETEANLYV